MSFLETKSLNPHILLHAFSLPPLSQEDKTPLKRLYLLARTRQFDTINATASSITSVSFPSLPQKIAKAKAESQARKEKLGANKALDYLKELDEISKGEDPNFEKIDQGQADMYELAKIYFEEGQYGKSVQLLTQLQLQDLKEELWLKTTWARLYCQIIQGKQALKTLDSLKKKMEDIETEQLAFLNKTKANTDALMKRLYVQKEEFLILSLFVVFKSAGEEEMERFVQYCTNDKSYFSVIQLTCPQLFRYVIVAIILNKTLQSNRNFDLFKLVEVINRKYVKYTDPFTEFIELLEVEYNFEEATNKIQECRKAIKEDIFLRPYEERIVEGLNFLYFKRVCKVYDTVSLGQISSFTGLSAQDAELWLLGYIRSGDIDAKIDSIAELVINNKGKQGPSESYLDIVPTLGGLVNSLSRAITTK